MKQFYLLLILFISFNLSFAQDEILGEWFVQSITTDGVQHDCYINMSIDFTQTPSEVEGYNSFIGDTSCNFYFGDYEIVSNNLINIFSLGQSDSCSPSDAYGIFYYKYSAIITPDAQFSNTSFNYSIEGTGDNQILTISNLNGDFVVYGKEEPTTTIFKTWYSYSTETADGIIYPSTLDNTTLELSPLNDGTISMSATGSGGCNEFFADHNIYTSNENELDILLFTQTLLDCSEENFYEPTYFSVLGIDANGPFSYELLDEGNTLVLTNEIGEILTFGEQAPPANMMGEWFLYHVVVDGNQTDRPDGTLPTIEFTTTPDIDGFYYGGIVGCTGYGGGYHFNPQQTFDSVYLSTTLGEPCYAFEDLYLYNILNSPNDNPTELDYEITGAGDDASLVVTNLSNGNQAFYGRQALSIEDYEFNASEIVLTRNPVKNSLELSTTQNLSGSNYEVFSITGQRIANGVLNSNSIDVNQLQSGLYFLKVSTAENMFETVKFIKD